MQYQLFHVLLKRHQIPEWCERVLVFLGFSGHLWIKFETITQKVNYFLHSQSKGILWKNMPILDFLFKKVSLLRNQEITLGTIILIFLAVQFSIWTTADALDCEGKSIVLSPIENRPIYESSFNLFFPFFFFFSIPWGWRAIPVSSFLLVSLLPSELFPIQYFCNLFFLSKC